MKFTLTALLFFGLWASGAHAQDKFIDEDGVVYDFTTSPSIPVSSVGVFVIYIDFQSPLQDMGTGLFSAPALEGGYSLRPVAWDTSELEQYNYNWVFSNTRSKIDASVHSFDSATGSGVAKVIFPCNLFSNSTSSGQLHGGAPNRLTVFLGAYGQLFITEYLEPTSFLASKQIDFDVHIPDVSVVFPENRGLMVGRSSSMMIVFSESAVVDRVFNIAPSSPLLNIQTSVVVLADEIAVEIPFLATEAGSLNVFVSDQANPSIITKSQLAKISTPPTFVIALATPASSDPVRVEPRYAGPGGANKRCLHFRACQPSGHEYDSESMSTTYSACTESPQPTCANGLPVGGAGLFMYEADCVFTWNPYSWCYFNSPGEDKVVAMPHWELNKVSREVCGSSTWALGLTVAFRLLNPSYTYSSTSTKFRSVCDWIRLDSSTEYISDDCI